MGFRLHVVLFSLALTTAVAPPVDACVNVTKAALDESVRNLKIAEGYLDANDLANARKWNAAALTFLDDLKAAPITDGKVYSPDGTSMPAPDPGLYRRSARIRALVRSRGPKATSAEREEAMTIFEKEVLGANPDPAVLIDYAEILSRVPARAPQAAMTLRMFREKDLIGSAFAYAALAGIEKQAGDAAAERAARERCRVMAKKPAMCS